MVDAAGNIVNLEVAEDPTWHMHGPTCLIPTSKARGPDGRMIKYRDEKVFADTGYTIVECARDYPELYAEYITGKRNPAMTTVKRELTLAYKNSDMDIVPHPWIYNRPEYFTGHTIIMADPFSTDMQMMGDLFKASNAKVVHDTIKQSFKFDNTALNRKGPPGVMVHALRYGAT